MGHPSQAPIGGGTVTVDIPYEKQVFQTPYGPVGMRVGDDYYPPETGLCSDNVLVIPFEETMRGQVYMEQFIPGTVTAPMLMCEPIFVEAVRLSILEGLKAMALGKLADVRNWQLDMIRIQELKFNNIDSNPADPLAQGHRRLIVKYEMWVKKEMTQQWLMRSVQDGFMRSKFETAFKVQYIYQIQSSHVPYATPELTVELSRLLVGPANHFELPKKN